MQELHERVESLERQMRAWRRTAVAVALCALAALASGVTAAHKNATGTVMKAPLRVVDANGKTLLEVRDTAEAGGGGAVLLFDAYQRPVAVLSADKEGGSLQMSDPAGKPRAHLTVLENGGALWIADRAGQTLGLLQETPNGGSFFLSDNNGRVQYSRP